MKSNLNLTLTRIDRRFYQTYSDIFQHKPYFLMGRASGSDLRIFDPYCSRCHAMLVCHQAQAYLIAYGQNGTYYEDPGRCLSYDSVIYPSKADLMNTISLVLPYSSQRPDFNSSKEVLNQIPGYVPGKMSSIDDLHKLISGVLDKSIRPLLVKFGRPIKHGGIIGLGNVADPFLKLRVSIG